MRNCRKTLRICKFLEERGELVKPECYEEFHIKVESCSQKRYYSLNPENCFCVTLEGLGNETFCVSEDCCDDFETLYLIDGCPCDKACVDFDDCDFHRIAIVNRPLCKEGSLFIRARIEDACGNAICDFRGFRVRICGDDFEKIVPLNESNCFEACIDEIPFGNYCISISNMNDFDAIYRFNGCVGDCGNITIDGSENTLDIIARHNNPTKRAIISRWCRDGNGRLVRPAFDECFDIRVGRRNQAFKEFALDCENHFTHILEGNRNDVFTIEMLDDCGVTYEVDGVKVDCVRIRMDEDHDVRIIGGEGCEEEGCHHDECDCDDWDDDNDWKDDCECNDWKHDCECDHHQEKPDCECHRGNGLLRISKWIDDNGRLRRPNRDDCFTIRIQGLSEKCFTLDRRNNFTLCLDNVRSGYYCIYEESNHDFDVCFEVNGCKQEDGYVFVNAGEETDVKIINMKRHDCGCHEKEHMLRIMKRIADHRECACDEDLIMPKSGSFEIKVSGPDGCQRYTLCEDNCYEVSIPLTKGRYTVMEMNPCNRVTYIVDGVKSDEACVEVCEEHHEVIVVNHHNSVNYVL